MNNRAIRAFAIGLLLSTSLIGSVYYFGSPSGTAKELTEEQLVKKVKDLGYSVTKEEQAEPATPEEQPEATTEQGDTTEETAPAEATPPAAEPAPEAAPPAVVEYSLNIISGMNTSEIATILKDAGVVDDAFNFEQYLINSGYHTKVQIGTFVVKSDMTYEQIAIIITKS